MRTQIDQLKRDIESMLEEAAKQRTTVIEHMEKGYMSIFTNSYLDQSLVCKGTADLLQAIVTDGPESILEYLRIYRGKYLRGLYHGVKNDEERRRSEAYKKAIQCIMYVISKDQRAGFPVLSDMFG